MFPPLRTNTTNQLRLFSTTRGRLLNNGNNDNDNNNNKKDDLPTPQKLTHVTASGSAHMVSISDKQPTRRTAQARCAVRFSSRAPLALIRDNQMKKGDVLGVARVAGLMAAKRTPDLIPLCHPVALTHAEVELALPQDDGGDGDGGGFVIGITATVSCDGKTGVEMEALTAAGAAALTVYDMCKAVDKGMVIEGLRVVLKEGGRSGRWVEGERDGNGA